MSDPGNKGNANDDDTLPRGRGDRIVSTVIVVVVVVLAIAIWADTPASAPSGDRALSRMFLRLVITVVVGGFLYSWWRKSRKSA